MSEIKYNIPNEERQLHRIEELAQAIENFPDSPLIHVWKKAIAEIEKERV